MKAKRFLPVLLVIAMVLSLMTPSLAADKADTPEPLRIAVLSDLHYISPDLIADTADFEHAMNMDRKMLIESDAINNELIDAVKKDKPDVLLICGDLTKDGEQENHRVVSEKLQQLKAAVPGLKIYLINGNHDVRNSDGQNFNTEDGVAVPATRTDPQDFKEIYDFVYSDESVIASYTPPEGKEAGSLTYVARPYEGYTFIAVDTCRYSADNTDDEVDEHSTSGAISAELEQWVTEQIAAAKDRGDMVIAFEHHGLVPHFSMEPDLMPMYLVKDFDRISEEWADAGLDLVFTGHMHALDIAAMTTDNGSTLYDIETGSALTFPSPVRFVDIGKNANGGTVIDIVSEINFGPISYTKADGSPGYIENITEAGRELGLSESMLVTVAGSFLGDFLEKITLDNALSDWANAKIIAKVQDIVRDVVNIPVADGSKTLLEAVNYIYQMNLSGTDDGNYPEWVQQALAQVESGEVLDEIIRIIKHHAFITPIDKVNFDNLITQAVKAKINEFILDVADSFGNDSNYTEDINTRIVIGGAATDEPVVSENRFVDVKEGAYYYDAVMWGVENGIVKGTSDTTFSPDASANRAMMVTMLHRYMGEPEATITETAFTDVDTDAYYYNALLWAVENGVVKGTSATTFSPNMNVTRAQVVTMLYRLAGEPEAAGGTDFTDVAADAYYADAVAWAVENGITNGMSDTSFAPDAQCTRGQLITFIYRYAQLQPAQAAA